MEGSARQPYDGEYTERRGMRSDRRPPRRIKMRWRRVVIAALTVVVVVFLWLLFQPFAGDGDGKVRILIPKQTGVGEVAEILDNAGVVSSAFLFEVRTTVSGSRGDLKPGRYTLREGMSYGAAISALKKGPPHNVVHVVVPEGVGRIEIAKIAKKDGISGRYMKASKRSVALDPHDYGAPKGTASLEGFLFPATYELKRGARASTFVEHQLQAFKREFKKVNLSYARSKNLTKYDVLIIASMIEREATLSKERPKVASVIYNRLKKGMPLGIDATVRFSKNNWGKPLTNSELASDSPYNTRRRTGLTPTPIGNPGLASIEAAARPAKTSYLYYVVKPNACNEHAFSSSEEQFQHDSERYQSERARKGKSPTSCPE